MAAQLPLVEGARISGGARGPCAPCSGQQLRTWDSVSMFCLLSPAVSRPPAMDAPAVVPSEPRASVASGLRAEPPPAPRRPRPRDAEAPAAVGGGGAAESRPGRCCVFLLISLGCLTFRAGLHAERPRQGDRPAQNHGEGPREEAAPRYVGLRAHLQPEGQRPRQGHEQFTHLSKFRYVHRAHTGRRGWCRPEASGEPRGSFGD